MRIALAQLNYTIGDFDQNRRKIIASIRNARDMQADLVVFSELCVCGYPPRDFLEFEDFIQRSNTSVKLISEECRDIAAIVGAPTFNPVDKGKNLLNSALLLSEGEIIGEAHKALLPNYDIFDEYRYFEPNRDFRLISYKGCRIALTICEDLWNIGPDPLYVQAPMEVLAAGNPQLLINIAASPFTWNQESLRMAVLRKNVEQYGLPLLYVNHVGAQTELLFDGNSKVIDKQGHQVVKLKAFEEDFTVVEFIEDSGFLHPVCTHPIRDSKADKPALIQDALVMGIRDYFSKMGFSRAILGLSGGIDSAVTLALAVKALGAENVRSILLPSRFSSEHSVNDARQLAENLHSPYDIISIEDGYQSILRTLSPQFAGTEFNITEENIQARLRAVILMALANKFGYILLNTSNKSEAAVGYGTLYGDMCGGLSVLGDVYKTDVYLLAKYINRDKELIPLNSIIKPPSAELRPGQKDSDSLPEYSVLDTILFRYIEERESPSDIIAAGFDQNLVQRILGMVNRNEWKRQQTPPILRVSPKAFGSGRRIPVVGKYLS